MDTRFHSTQFPRSSAYHPDWIAASASGGAPCRCLTEWLCQKLALRPGMRVLDLGCGRAASSIFLHREFGVEVWAVDLWIDPSENLQRIRDAGAGSAVFPLRSDARALPFARDFFDAVVSIDSFVYYGTDDLFLGNLVRFLKPGGLLGIAGAGLVREIEGEVPAHLQSWWEPALWSLHSAAWWKRHWEKSGMVDVECSDALADGHELWMDWQRFLCPENEREIRAVEADAGQYLGYVRTIGHRRAESRPEDPMTSIPAHYENKPLLRSGSGKLPA